MKKLMLAMFVCVFSLSALACDGDGKGKKDKEEDKRFEKVTLV